MKKQLTYKLISVGFLTFFCVNLFMQSFVLLSFKINQEYIASNFCIEKDLEESTCKGNCQLMKSIKKVTKSSNKEEVPSQIETHITGLYPNEIFQLSFIDIISIEKMTNSVSGKIKKGFDRIPFLPPIV